MSALKDNDEEEDKVDPQFFISEERKSTVDKQMEPPMVKKYSETVMRALSK